MSSDGRAVFITGAARGIGLATAEAFLADGYQVAIADIDVAEAESSANQLDPSGERVIGIAADVTSTESIDSAITTTTDRFGGLQALVNNAGTINPQPSRPRAS